MNGNAAFSGDFGWCWITYRGRHRRSHHTFLNIPSHFSEYLGEFLMSWTPFVGPGQVACHPKPLNCPPQKKPGFQMTASFERKRLTRVPKNSVSRSKHVLKPQPQPRQHWGLELRTSLTKAGMVRNVVRNSPPHLTSSM